MGFLKKHLLIIIGVIALLMVAAGVYFGRVLNEQNETLMAEITTLKNRLEGYYRDRENAPSPYVVRRLEAKKLAAESGYESLTDRYAILPYLTLPEREIFPVLYYKEMVYHVLDTIYRRASRLGVALPESLAIPETGLPQAAEVPTLFILLDTVQRLCEEIFASRLHSLDSIEIQAIQTSAFFVEVPFAITVTGTSSRVAYFMENLGSSRTIFVLENMAMTGTDDRVQASLSLKRIIWGEELAGSVTTLSVPGLADRDDEGDDDLF